MVDFDDFIIHSAHTSDIVDELILILAEDHNAQQQHDERRAEAGSEARQGRYLMVEDNHPRKVDILIKGIAF